MRSLTLSLSLIALLGSIHAGLRTIADDENTVVIEHMQDLARCRPEQLDAVFASGWVTGIPTGRLQGTPLVNPGSRNAVQASRTGRLFWSGKHIEQTGADANNFFFGVPSVRAKVSIQNSLRDGRPAIVLDYSGTSLVYRNVRDEIREVAPGVYLGYVDDTRTPEPTTRRWFALETTRGQ